ncbi:MAG: hypothetical protein ACYSWW_16275 [Planctomycetota bacterium]|jgi:hypothetical protein
MKDISHETIIDTLKILFWSEAMRKKPEPKSKRPADIKSMSVEELIQLRVALDVEQRQRGIAFSIGDIGEDGEELAKK